jgi:hypothetical protein
LILEQWMWTVKRREKTDWFGEERIMNCIWFGISNRRSTRGSWIVFNFLRAKSLNRQWNRDFKRFHPILTILPYFNPILPDFEFRKRFST